MADVCQRAAHDPWALAERNTHPQQAADPRRVAGQHRFRGPQFDEDPFGVLDQRSAGRRERHSIADPIDQRGSGFALQGGELLRDRRAGVAQRACRGRDRALGRDRAQHDQFANVEHPSHPLTLRVGDSNFRLLATGLVAVAVLDAMPVSLVEKQRISTSGARAVAPFTVGGHQLLAIPQLALDIPGQEPNMNGGDSDTDLLLLQRTQGRYVPWSTLPAPGGEDAEFFTIQGRSFLAVASIRSGRGPYDFTTDSAIFEWDGNGFVLFQSVETFAAKQWKHWQIGERHFLGLAQGVGLPDLASQNRDSFVYEWDGSSFVEFQRIKSQWAYNWHPFFVGETFFVAHADHLDESLLYRWDGERLRPHQTLTARGGRRVRDVRP